MLGPVGRGEFAAACLWLILPALIATSGLRSAVVYLSNRDREQAGSICIDGLLVATAVFVPLSAASWFATPYLMHTYPPRIVALAQIIAVLSVVNVWSMMARQGILAAKNYRAFNLTGAGNPFVYLLLLSGLAAFGLVTPVSATTVQLLGVVLVLFPTVVIVVRGWRGLSIRVGTTIRSLCRYSLGAAPIDIVAVLNGWLDRIVLVGLVSAYDFGLYVVAISFARILYVLQTVVSTVMLTDLAAKPAAEIELFVHRAFRVMLWGLAAVFGIALLLDTQVLGLVYGERFVAAVPLFRVLLFEAIVACLGYMLTQAFLASGKPGLPSFLQVFTFGLALVGMFALTPHYGAMGAAVALAAASTVRVLLLLCCLRRIGVRLPNPLPRASDFAPLLQRAGMRPAMAASLGREESGHA